MNYKIRITAENQAIVKRIADENGMNPFGYLFKNHGKSYTVINNKFDNIWVENATELTTEQFIELFDKKETLAGRWFQALKDNVASSQIVKGQFYLIEKEDDKLIFFKVPTFEDTEWLFKLNKEVHKNEFKLMPKDFQLIQETELDKWLKETKAKNLSLEQLENFISRGTNVSIWYSLEGVNSEQKAQILFNQWNNPTEKSPKVETEWQPKRGDRVLVWDYSYQEPKERIFLSTDGHEDFPILALRKSKEGKFKDKIYGYKHMKPLPIEQPKETDFKTKVIELIETKINDLKGYEKRQIERNEYYNNHSQVASKIKVYNDLINQIKQL
jgi:hypothetical protein